MIADVQRNFLRVNHAELIDASQGTTLQPETVTRHLREASVQSAEERETLEVADPMEVDGKLIKDKLERLRANQLRSES